MIDINILIIITVFSTCLVTIIQTFQGILTKNDGWIIIAFSIILVTALLLVFHLNLSAWIGGSLLIIFLLIPQWGLRRINRLFEIQNYHQSRRLLSKLMVLHFTPYWQNYYRLLLALELADKGNRKKAINLLNKNNNTLPIFSHYYQLFTYEILGDWQSCLQWFNYQLEQKILWRDPLLLTYYIRTLGETGELNQLFQNLLKVQSVLLKYKKYSYISRIKLSAFAFSGQFLAVKKLLQSELSFYPKYLQEFWLVTAKTVRDQNKNNYKIILQKYLQDHHLLKSSIQWRIKQRSIPFLNKIKNSNYKILFQLNFKEKPMKENYKTFNFKIQKFTLFFIILNSLGFMTEISFGGSENLESLYQLGALVPMVVWQGEFWRLVTANFLHYGWGHFLMNMFALYIIGNLVESLSNKYHYIIIYILSGVGSMFIFSYVALYANKLDYIVVGASASIMGLVGSLTAIFLRKWLQDKSAINRKRLLIMIMVISLQLVSDTLIPQVSMLSHLFGLLIGFALENLGYFLLNRKTHP
ncbi:rhomboid family intramembrane serine protease [Cyanothece sp. BG0011]|uniref:rhomboid family intramembrane serine protease n=1 Tax=Cyanothece sp. BG0011 TaxID=2082950 RepID=UPI000D1F34D1|nr:rhomboid family intramembrane serine protease [Cyanothece sp. BG0011]